MLKKQLKEQMKAGKLIMKKMVKAAICGTVLVASLGLGMIAEAGRIPSHMVPLYTYATKKVTCYNSAGGTAQGWIDQGDYVIVSQIRSDGWAKGTYPVGNKRIPKWFRIDDLLNNPSFRTLERMSPTYRVKVYKNYAYNGEIGSVSDNEDLWVVSNLGDVWQIVYKVNSGGYKMGWVPYWDCLQKPIKNPIVKPISRTQTTAQIAQYWNNMVGKVPANLSLTLYNTYYLSNRNFKKYYDDDKPPYKHHSSNCTWYAWARMKEVTGIELSFSGSAFGGNWGNTVNKNNCYVDNNLTSQCVAERSGHVAFVEYVNGNDVYYTEANVNSNTDFKVIKTTVSAFKRQGFYRFIHKK